MTRKKSTKRALLFSAFSLLVCVAMFIGTTFAWFTDSVTSTGNKIEAGTLKIDLLLKDGDDDWTSIKDSNKAIFDYNNWEPGYTDVKVLKIVNEGSLALKWLAKFMSASGTELTALADVIDVYVNTSVQDMPTDRAAISTWENVGTVREFVNTIKETTKGELTAESAAYLGIALKMRESAGNEYQGMDLGGAFDIQIIATQLTYEKDSFDELYDKDADLDFTLVSNAAELRTALASKEPNIRLTKDILIDNTFNVNYDPVIDGDGYKMYRVGGSVTAANAYTGEVFKLGENAALTLTDVVVDGGAVWSSLSGNQVENSGVTATGDLIKAGKNSQIILNDGAVLQNNDGAYAVNLDTRIGATLTMNGGWIIGNRSAAGAVWGGGHITMNEGSKINNNRSTGSAGAIRMVGKCNLTMNGGEICNNVAAKDGGAIWGYGTNGNSSVYNLNSGKISGNIAGGVGGGIYTGTYSTINLSGDFEISNNTASDSGAMRVTNYTIFNMTGGKISGNVSTTNDKYDGFYSWCPRLNISGGELADNIYIAGGHTPTIGGGEITGTIYFNVGTNHNTINLASNFGTFKFVAVEGSNFSAFNFKPAADYVYTEGDEAKLICQNVGYSTYWDAATSRFRLQAE